MGVFKFTLFGFHHRHFISHKSVLIVVLHVEFLQNFDLVLEHLIFILQFTNTGPIVGNDLAFGDTNTFFRREGNITTVELKGLLKETRVIRALLLDLG